MTIRRCRYRLNPIDDTFLSPVEIELELEFKDDPDLGVGVRFAYRASEQPYAGKRDFSTSGFIYPITGSLCDLYGVPDGCYHLPIDGYAAPSRHLGTGTSSFVWRWLYDVLPTGIRDRLHLSGKIVPGDAGDGDPDNWVRKCRLWGGLMGQELPTGQRDKVLPVRGLIQPASLGRLKMYWQIEEI